MQRQNMHPNFFPSSHWWCWPLLALPESLLARWLRKRLRNWSPGDQETPSRDLWQGKGSILLLTEDPRSFQLLGWMHSLASRFPGLRLVALSEQATWWQALAPTLNVIALPSAHVFGNGAWWRENLSRLAGDWCIDLHPSPAHPLSLALADVVGRCWRIGSGTSSFRNVAIESSAATPFDGALLRSLASTFQWEDAASTAVLTGHRTYLHLPTIPPKKRPSWIPALQELQRKHQATVVGTGDLQGWESLSPAPMPAPSHLLQQGIGTWIGPRSTASGALSASGARHIELPESPDKVQSLND